MKQINKQVSITNNEIWIRKKRTQRKEKRWGRYEKLKNENYGAEKLKKKKEYASCEKNVKFNNKIHPKNK